MRAVPVPSGDLDQWRGRLGWHVDQFCANGQYEPEDLFDQISRRERQLWLVVDADAVKCALLTSIAVDRLKTCQVTHCAGEEYTSWVSFWDVIEAWAKEIGCQRIEVTARPGWARVLKGLTRTHIVLEKRL